MKMPNETEIYKVFPQLHCEDHLKSQYSCFSRIFGHSFLVMIFCILGYANDTAFDLTLHNDF